MPPLVLPAASRAVVDACCRLGVDHDALLRRAGVDPSRLENPDDRIPAGAADAIWMAAWELAGDPDLALHAAEATPFGSYRVLDYLGSTGPTLGAGLQRIASYFPLVDPRGSLSVHPYGHDMALRFQSTTGLSLPPPAQQYTLAILLGRARHATGTAWRLTRVCFTFPTPTDSGEHHRVFGVSPRFGASHAELVIPRAVWDGPTRSGDPGLFAVLDEHARVLFDNRPVDADLETRVRQAIAESLAGQEPLLPVVARKVALSRRSLQRKLEEDGTTFANLVDAVRRERAEAFLRERDVAVSEVSWLLGFSDQSAFSRAFRRWTGLSPSAYRASSTALTARARRLPPSD